MQCALHGVLTLHPRWSQQCALHGVLTLHPRSGQQCALHGVLTLHPRSSQQCAQHGVLTLHPRSGQHCALHGVLTLHPGWASPPRVTQCWRPICRCNPDYKPTNCILSSGTCKYQDNSPCIGSKVEDVQNIVFFNKYKIKLKCMKTCIIMKLINNLLFQIRNNIKSHLMSIFTTI